MELQFARELVRVGVDGRAVHREEEDMLGGELAADELGGRVGHPVSCVERVNGEREDEKVGSRGKPDYSDQIRGVEMKTRLTWQ